MALRSGIAPGHLLDTEPSVIDEMIRQLNEQDKKAEQARR